MIRSDAWHGAPSSMTRSSKLDDWMIGVVSVGSVMPWKIPGAAIGTELKDCSIQCEILHSPQRYEDGADFRNVTVAP